MVEYNLPKLKRLEKRYKQALKDGDKVFTFEGGDYIPGYAKYLIEYLKTKL